MQEGPADSFGRRFRYLRLSVTEACNFRCEYCLPDGYRGPASGFLDADEIGRLLRAFAGLGIRKLRLTGGEPLVRKDLVTIVEHAAQVGGIGQRALTTNGYRLEGLAAPLRQAGLNVINISLDSLNAEKFQRITGDARHATVLRGIDAALAAGFDTVKLNTVLLAGRNADEVPDFIEFVRRRPLTVRFIELMRTTGNAGYFQQRHVAAAAIARRLQRDGWERVPREATAGPADEYHHPDYLGRVGLITPYAAGFCDTCNRLRVTARGQLRLCLFGRGGVDLRPLLSSDTELPELQRRIVAALGAKPASHQLGRGDCGDTAHLAATGG